MANPRDSYTGSGRPPIVRLHSPYCEATGPIVESGTVAARILALQQDQNGKQDNLCSHNPKSQAPPGRLKQDIRAQSPCESLASARLSLRKSHNHLNDYMSNGDSDSTFGYGRRSPPEDIYTTAIMQDHHQPHCGTSGQSQSNKPEAQATDRPSSARKKTWLQTIRDNAAVRNGRKIQDTNSAEIVPTPLRSPGPPERTVSDTWPENCTEPGRVPSEATIESPKPIRAPYKTIADQLGDMIDKALEEPDDTATDCSVATSAFPFTGISGDVHRGRLDLSNFQQPQDASDLGEQGQRARETTGLREPSSTQTPWFAEECSETPRSISPIHRTINHMHISEDVPVLVQNGQTAALNSATRDHESRTKRNYTRASTFPRHSSDTEDQLVDQQAIARRKTAGTRSMLPTGKQFPNHKPQRPDRNTFQLLSLPRSGEAAGKKTDRDNDCFEVYAQEYHDLSVHATKEHKHDDISPDGRRKASQRTRSGKAKKQHPPEQSVVRPSLPAPSPSRWKWWKLVLVDKESSKGERAQIEKSLEEKTGWAVEPHPLAECCHEDEGYASNDVKAAPALKGRRSSRPDSDDAIASGSAQKGSRTPPSQNHDNGDQLCLSGDASLDAFHSTPTSTVGTLNARATPKTPRPVKPRTRANNSRIEVRTRGGAEAVRFGTGSQRSGGELRVVVSVSDILDSVVKVDIRPGLL